MLPAGFLAHILPPSIDSCWLGFRVHAPPQAIQSLPFPLHRLHPLTSTWPNTPSVDFCPAVRPPLDSLSPLRTQDRSPGVISAAFHAQSPDLRFAPFSVTNFSPRVSGIISITYGFLDPLARFWPAIPGLEGPDAILNRLEPEANHNRPGQRLAVCRRVGCRRGARLPAQADAVSGPRPHPGDASCKKSPPDASPNLDPPP